MAVGYSLHFCLRPHLDWSENVSQVPIRSDYASLTIHNKTIIDAVVVVVDCYNSVQLSEWTAHTFLFTAFSCDEDSEAAVDLSIAYRLVILNANCRYIYWITQCWSDTRECVNCFWLVSVAKRRQIFTNHSFKCHRNSRKCNNWLIFADDIRCCDAREDRNDRDRYEVHHLQNRIYHLKADRDMMSRM